MGGKKVTPRAEANEFTLNARTLKFHDAMTTDNEELILDREEKKTYDEQL